MTATLPEPPRDASALVNAPAVRLDAGWRVFRADHGPVFFFRGPSRFVPTSPGDVGVLYLADSMQTALIEAFGGRDFVTPLDFEGSAVARVPLAQFRLADATGRGGATFGLTPNIALAADEGPSQRWAAALISAGFDGVVYPARHSDGGRIVAVFGAAGSTGSARGLVEVMRISREDLTAIGTRVIPVPGDDELTFTELE